MRVRSRILLALLALATTLSGFLPAAADRFEIARGGRARVPIRIPEHPTDVERNAAGTLASYLSTVTGAEFEIETGPGPAPSIEIGATQAAREIGLDVHALGAEEWFLHTTGDRLLLAGGAPRGTIYAVVRFLEDEIGVRWWTPWDEFVPRRKRLRVGPIDRRGRPFFSYRDIFGIGESDRFPVFSRLNGDSSAISEPWGGSLRFGPPFHVHTFDRRVSVGRWWDEHPEFFSEVGGFRYGGRTQWCLTQEKLLDVVEGQLWESIESGEANARSRGASIPVYYDVSQNDWGQPCECATCSAVVEREGSQSGPVIRFVSTLADRVSRERPDLRLTTLAYHYTFEPPAGAVAGEFLEVRLADLYQRDFGHGFLAPSNDGVRERVRRWAEHATHLVIWDYRVTFHEGGDLPRGDHRWLGDQLRFYAGQGVEGLYVQTGFPDVGDMHDLEVWLTAKLLEQPRQDDRALTREFLRGYYGRAASSIGAYLEDLGGAVDRSAKRLGFAPPPGDYTWLDRGFLEAAQRRFARAERRVAGNAGLVARVRGARVALDRATLARWDRLWPPGGEPPPWPRLEIGQRYEQTRRRRIEHRLDGALKRQALDNLKLEMEWMQDDE